MHCARIPRGMPITAVQAPRAPATLHASHWPPQARSQHTPSTQKPETHSLAAEHIPPLGRRPMQTPITQTLPMAQSASVRHSVRHSSSPQVKGMQGVVLAMGQLPTPSQVAASVATPSMQLGNRHEVPVGG